MHSGIFSKIFFGSIGFTIGVWYDIVAVERAARRNRNEISRCAGISKRSAREDSGRRDLNGRKGHSWQYVRKLRTENGFKKATIDKLENRDTRRNGKSGRVRCTQRYTAVLLMAAALVTGCGAQEKLSYTKQGMNAVEALEYEAALEYFETGLDQEEDRRMIYRGMGLAFMGMTRYEDAILYLEAALHESGGRVEDLDFDMNYYLATAYYKSGRAEDAVRAYDAILALRPKEKNAFYLRGYVKLSRGEFEQAQKDFDAAVALDGKDYDQMIRIYMALEEYGYKEAGMVYLKKVMAENEKSITDYDMGRMCYYMGDYEQAREYLSRMDSAKEYGAALYLGRTYEALGDYNYASSIYAAFTENDQTRAEIYNQLGLCRMQMKEYSAALEAFQAAMNIEDNGMMQSLKFNEIVAYEYMGDFKTASALMNSYLQSYPDDAAAKREYEFLRTR